MKFKNPVSVVSPVNGEHATNKDYVDSKQQTITWVEYQALSEAEKNNGTVYYIPDMPVSASGEAIGEVERLNGYLASVPTLSTGTLIPFVADSNSNMEITNGLVTLKKGKTYNIYSDIRFEFSESYSYAFYALKDATGNVIGTQAADLSTNRDSSTGAHTSIKYSITPTEDITVGVYVISENGIRGLDEESSKFIITEIPSLQACIDVSDEHIKEIAKESYSTEEQVIGTWIDGKPLYRKVIVDTTKSQIDLSSINIDYINLSKSVFIVHGVNVNNYTNGTDYVYTVYDSNTKILATVTGGNATSLLSKIIYILEYTKTTD